MPLKKPEQVQSVEELDAMLEAESVAEEFDALLADEEKRRTQHEFLPVTLPDADKSSAEKAALERAKEIEMERVYRQALIQQHGTVNRHRVDFMSMNELAYNMTDPVQVAERLEEYFNTTLESQWTLSGIALYVGIEWQDLIFLSEERPKIKQLLAKARLLVQTEYEKSLRASGKGDMFVLKNLGWKDKTEVNQTSQVVVMPVIKTIGAHGEQTPLTFEVGKQLDVVEGQVVEDDE
jgi:hypothetical protein